MKPVIIVLILLAPTLAAQCTAGPASNAVSISCQAPPSQTQGLIRILNRVLSAGLDPDAVLVRLDTIPGSTARPASEPRIISAADLDRLTRALAVFKGQKASLGYAAADAEAARLADQLDDLLHRAGWTQTSPVISAAATARGDSPGIDLTVAERTRATDALWNGLLAAGLDVIAHINPAAIRDGSISIFVYSRR